MPLAPPPIRTSFKATPGQQPTPNNEQIPSWGWLRWFQQIQIEQNTPISANPPALSNAAGVQGQAAFDQNFLYVCVATNTWKRIPLTAF